MTYDYFLFHGVTIKNANIIKRAPAFWGAFHRHVQTPTKAKDLQHMKIAKMSCNTILATNNDVMCNIHVTNILQTAKVPTLYSVLMKTFD